MTPRSSDFRKYDWLRHGGTAIHTVLMQVYLEAYPAIHRVCGKGRIRPGPVTDRSCSIKLLPMDFVHINSSTGMQKMKLLTLNDLM